MKRRRQAVKMGAVGAAFSMALNRKANRMSHFFFLHAPSGESWEVADPVQWCVDNAHQPILEPARERLLTLTAADRERIVRLVARRCKLNLIEIQPARVVIHHWGEDGLGDLPLVSGRNRWRSKASRSF